MSSGTNIDLRQLFAQVLRDPNSVSDAQFDQLLVAYPYAQSVAFARQRRASHASASDDTLQKALLHAGNKYWLNEFIGEQQPSTVATPDSDLEVASKVTPERSSLVSDNDGKDLESLIFEQAAAADYFASTELEAVEQQSVRMPDSTASNESAQVTYTEAESEEVGPTASEQSFDTVPTTLPETIRAEGTDEADDLSVYDDELMPYSFRWWLYKTRLAHADTYQPFVKSIAQANGHQAIKNKFDETILDHQIRENIFHLQKPEDKLSDAVRLKTVEVAMPKKTDAIIERFIREEPQIQPPTPDLVNNENKARKSAEDRFSLVTETLANIYIEQGLYPKAIDVFKKLISINPEKKLYFATRIEELEQKI